MYMKVICLVLVEIMIKVRNWKKNRKIENLFYIELRFLNVVVLLDIVEEKFVF